MVILCNGNCSQKSTTHTSLKFLQRTTNTCRCQSLTYILVTMYNNIIWDTVNMTIIHAVWTHPHLSCLVFGENPRIFRNTKGNVSKLFFWNCCEQMLHLCIHSQISSFCGYLPRYHLLMASIVAQISLVLVDRVLTQVEFKLWTRCHTNMDGSITIHRISIGRITLKFSLYFNFIIIVSVNIWRWINTAILLPLKPV